MHSFTIGNLATVLKAQNKLDEAEKTLKDLHKRRLRVLGTTHRDTLTTLANLASNLSRARGPRGSGRDLSESPQRRDRVPGQNAS